MASKTKIKVIDLDNKILEDISLSEKVFLAKENNDIIARLVNWQLAKKDKALIKLKKEEKSLVRQPKFINKVWEEPDMVQKK